MEDRRAREARRARENRAEARARKLCQLCPPKRRRPARPGKSTCVECSAGKSQSDREVLREQTRLGLCARGRCPNPRTAGSLCAEHAKEKRNYPSHGTNTTVERRAAENLCRDGCGRSAFKSSRCEECSEVEAVKAEQRRADRVAAGLCYRCGKNKAPPNKGCRTCVKKRRSKADRRKTPVPTALRRCGACGEVGHRKSARRCPKWSRR